MAKLANKRKIRVRLSPQQIERWVSRYFPSYKRRSKGKQLAIHNPFEADTAYHMWISLIETTTKTHNEPNYYVHDWRSGRYNMTFINFVKRYRQISFFEAIREVTGKDKKSLRDYLRQGAEVAQDEPDDETEKEIELPPLSQPFKGTSGKVRKVALCYLDHRRISEERAIELDLHWTPTTIVFPYIEYGVLVFWQERDVIDKIFRFPSEEKTGLAKTDYLYNFDNVEQPGGTVVLVESIINCINIGEGCTATGGASLSEEGKQIRKIAALDPSMVVLAPDYDKAGIESLVDNYMLLKKFLTNCRFGFCIPPQQGIDWNDIEKRDGVGSARKYIMENSVEFDLRKALELRSVF